MKVILDSNKSIIKKLHAKYEFEIDNMLKQAKKDRDKKLADAKKNKLDEIKLRKKRDLEKLEAYKDESISVAKANSDLEISKKKEMTFKEILSDLERKIEKSSNKESLDLLRYALDEVLNNISGDYELNTWSEMKEQPGSLDEAAVEINSNSFEIRFDCKDLLLGDEDAIYKDLEEELNIK